MSSAIYDWKVAWRKNCLPEVRFLRVGQGYRFHLSFQRFPILKTKNDIKFIVKQYICRSQLALSNCTSSLSDQHGRGSTWFLKHFACPAFSVVIESPGSILKSTGRESSRRGAWSERRKGELLGRYRGMLSREMLGLHPQKVVHSAHS